MISLDNYDIYLFFVGVISYNEILFWVRWCINFVYMFEFVFICIDYIEKVSIYNLFFFVVSFLKNFE